MSSQTSNSRFQTPLQSRAVCSLPSLSPSLNHQNRSLAPTNHPSAQKKMAPAYFEDYGLHVPLRKFGQQRLHARSASELSGKNRQSLLTIAKDITNGQVSKVKSASRGELALFVERVETLALGPHPKTTLPCEFTILESGEYSDCNLATKKEDLVEALGLKTRAQKSKAKKDAPRQNPASKKDSPPVQGKEIAQSTESFSKNEIKSRQTSASVRQATPPASSPGVRAAPKPVTAQKQISHHTSAKFDQVSQKSNKRKHDSADGPTDEQTAAKKPRIISTPSSKASGLPRVSAAIATKASVLETAPHTRLTTAEQECQSRITAPAPTPPTPLPATSPRIHEAPTDNKPSPNNARSPSSIPHISDPDITVLPTKPLTNDPPALLPSLPTNTPNSPTPHSPTPYSAPNQPSSPLFATKPPTARNPDRPFLKSGVHGRGGDFAHDPDRATGRGHRVEPQDLARRRAYDALFRAWKWREGFWTERRVEELKREERWMGKYRDKYPGEVVGHLWDCGCEVREEGEESEEE